jgi:hypothetical protein
MGVSRASHGSPGLRVLILAIIPMASALCCLVRVLSRIGVLTESAEGAIIRGQGPGWGENRGNQRFICSAMGIEIDS